MVCYYFVFLLILVFSFVYLLNKFLRKYGKDSDLSNQSLAPPIEKEEKDRRYKMVDEFINECQSTQQQHWSSLLTFNGLLLAVFTFIAVENSSHREIVIIIAFAILTCLLSSGLMVINFFSLITVFRERAKVYSPFLNMPKPDRDQKESNHLKLEDSERVARERNERWTFVLLAFQCSIIIAILCHAIRRFL